MAQAAAAQESKSVTVDTLDVGIDSTSPSNKVTWATGRNVRFIPGYVTKTPGKTNLATLGTPALPIRESFTFVATDGDVYTIICTDAQIFAANRDFSTITDITPTSAPTGGYYDIWEFCIVAGLPIITNGKDAIWKWPDQDQPLTPLLNAPLAKHISSCMNRLVCSNTYENTISRYGRTRWSEMGNPENWTVDTTRKSGYHDLVNYSGKEAAMNFILAQISIGSKTYYFTEKNLFVCDFAQPTKQFIIIDNSVELMSTKSVCEHRGILYAIAKDDIYQYIDGNKASIGRPQRIELYDDLNYLKIDTIFSFNIYSTNEVWFCVPTGTNTLPDTAYVYNTELGAWTICDCDFTCHALQYSKTVAWVNNLGATVTWENSAAQTISWLAEFYRAIAQDIVCDSASHILKMDSGYNAISTALAAVAIYGFIETGDFVLGARPFEKVIEELFPDMLAQTQASTLMIQVGSRNNLSEPPRWSKSVPFRIGIDGYADMRCYGSEGAFLRLRYYTSALDSPWAMGSYSFLYSIGARIR